ncbi:MAG: methionyl-tRNA formyltransferase [Candidatus Omnitrophica bacterium]|nr:methionyl-tRNA formyltransferase [Candidatus Omnitrophota bacterium]
MKIIFFGSDDFADAHFERLLDEGYQIVACVTQPDKPKDRGMKITMSPIKARALMHNIPVLQPETLKSNSIVEDLRVFNADVFVVIAYGRFLTPEILALPKIGSLNVHGSLLPKYRGAAPINWAILNGEIETGITIIRLNAQMDAGDIISQVKLLISEDETSVELRQGMIAAGCELLSYTLKNFNADTKGVPQDDKNISFAPKLTKQLGLIDWNRPAKNIHDQIRGLQPWPLAHTFIKNKQLSIFSSSIVDVRFGDVLPGVVVQINNEGAVIATGDGTLLIREVQPAGSRRMDMSAFVRGARLVVGDRFVDMEDDKTNILKI